MRSDRDWAPCHHLSPQQALVRNETGSPGKTLETPESFVEDGVHRVPERSLDARGAGPSPGVGCRLGPDLGRRRETGVTVSVRDHPCACAHFRCQGPGGVSTDTVSDRNGSPKVTLNLFPGIPSPNGRRGSRLASTLEISSTLDVDLPASPFCLSPFSFLDLWVGRPGSGGDVCTTQT